MSKPERGSLTSLLTKKPLGQGAPAAVTMEQAESALLTDTVQPNVRTHVAAVSTIVRPDSSEAEEVADAEIPAHVHTSVRTSVPPTVQATNLLNRSRRRTVRVPWTFKLPFELREELEAVARFNELNMTEIAVEAIERHLKHFPHPPKQA
jgi:hypothetical protein